MTSLHFAEHKDDILTAAHWLENRLKTAGLEVRIFEGPATKFVHFHAIIISDIAGFPGVLFATEFRPHVLMIICQHSLA